MVRSPTTLKLVWDLNLMGAHLLSSGSTCDRAVRAENRRGKVTRANRHVLCSWLLRPHTALGCGKTSAVLVIVFVSPDKELPWLCGQHGVGRTWPLSLLVTPSSIALPPHLLELAIFKVASGN